MNIRFKLYSALFMRNRFRCALCSMYSDKSATFKQEMCLITNLSIKAISFLYTQLLKPIDELTLTRLLQTH